MTKKTNLVKHIKYYTINQNFWSLRLLKRTNFKTKTSLFKTIMQPKISYSFPIYHLLSRPQKLKIQACKNIPICKFILGNIPYDQHPNSGYMHVKISLKILCKWHGSLVEHFIKAQTRTTRLYNMFEECTKLQIVKTKNSSQDITNAICQSTQTHILLQWRSFHWKLGLNILSKNLNIGKVEGGETNSVLNPKIYIIGWWSHINFGHSNSNKYKLPCVFRSCLL